jgi:hypothetical protein
MSSYKHGRFKNGDKRQWKNRTMGTDKQQFENNFSNGQAQDGLRLFTLSYLPQLFSLSLHGPLLPTAYQKLRRQTIQFAVLYLVWLEGLQIDF